MRYAFLILIGDQSFVFGNGQALLLSVTKPLLDGGETTKEHEAQNDNHKYHNSNVYYSGTLYCPRPFLCNRIVTVQLQSNH